MIIDTYTPAGDNFKYSINISNNYAEMWDVYIKKTYQWKWSEEKDDNHYMGGGSSSPRVTNYKFDENTGKFNVTTGESVYFADFKEGDILNCRYGYKWAYAFIKVSKNIMATSGNYKGMYNVLYYAPIVSVKNEEKLKGNNLLGVQFCKDNKKLLTQGINTYLQKEYYCVRKSK